MVNFEQTTRTLAAYFVGDGRFPASRRLLQLACLISSSWGDGEPNTSCAISAEDEANGLPHCVVHRRPSTSLAASQSDSGISCYCVKVASSGHAAIKLLEEESVAAVLLEYKLEGMDAEAVACHIKQRFPNLPIILLSAYAEMPERILWLVDEYVMKSEPPERLVPIVERVYRPALRSDEDCQRSGAAA